MNALLQQAEDVVSVERGGRVLGLRLKFPCTQDVESMMLTMHAYREHIDDVLRSHAFVSVECMQDPKTDASGRHAMPYHSVAIPRGPALSDTQSWHTHEPVGLYF